MLSPTVWSGTHIMNPGIVALDPLRCHFLTAGRKIHGPIHIAKDDPIPPKQSYHFSHTP